MAKESQSLDGNIVKERAAILTIGCPLYLVAMCYHYASEVNKWENTTLLCAVLGVFAVAPVFLSDRFPFLIRMVAATAFAVPIPFLYDIQNDNFGRMVIFSGLSVGFFRALAIVHDPAKWPTYAHRAIGTVTLCQLEHATKIPKGGKLKEALRRLALLTLPGALGVVVHRLLLANFSQETLEESVLINCVAMGLFATCALHGLDGLYGLMFVPLGICLPVMMNNPVPFSTSLSEFWGRRWNVSVSDALRCGVHRPLKRWIPSFHVRSAVAFLASAGIHGVQMHLWGCTLLEVASTVLYFISQWMLMFIEDRLLRVHSWPSPQLRRVWTFTVLIVSFVPFAFPLVSINKTWERPVEF